MRTHFCLFKRVCFQTFSNVWMLARTRLLHSMELMSIRDVCFLSEKNVQDIHHNVKLIELETICYPNICLCIDSFLILTPYILILIHIGSTRWTAKIWNGVTVQISNLTLEFSILFNNNARNDHAINNNQHHYWLNISDWWRKSHQITIWT